jgi:chromosome segregation ATPase
MPNLEGQLGELTGQLRALVPVLDRVEDRQAAADQKAAAAAAKHGGLSAECNDLRTKVSSRIAEHYKGIDTLGKENNDRKNDVHALRQDVAELQSQNDGVKQKVWDLLKIVVTIVLTLVATKLLGKS